jgi:hypothetical protein
MIYNRYVHLPYHGPEWCLYVEMGWVTMTVDDNGIACMIKIEGRGRAVR